MRTEFGRTLKPTLVLALTLTHSLTHSLALTITLTHSLTHSLALTLALALALTPVEPTSRTSSTSCGAVALKVAGMYVPLSVAVGA